MVRVSGGAGLLASLEPPCAVLPGWQVACACRKSNPNILVMQPAQDWKAKNTPCPLDRAR